MKRKDIISITGDLASGQSTVAKMLANDLEYYFYHNGAYFRQLAIEKNMSVTEFGEYVEKHPELDFFVYNWYEEYYYIIRPKNVTKSTTVGKLGRILQIPKEEIYTVGDNTNDIEMIRDYNGFMIGNCEKLEPVALKRYSSVRRLVKDIMNEKALKR